MVASFDSTAALRATAAAAMGPKVPSPCELEEARLALCKKGQGGMKEAW